MKCADRFCTQKNPELLAEKLPAEHDKAIQLSDGKRPTTRWACACGWTRYEITKTP